ncbi:MAG: ferredoxin [Planctomycetota bacterium]|jgi:ferredoxin
MDLLLLYAVEFSVSLIRAIVRSRELAVVFAIDKPVTASRGRSYHPAGSHIASISAFLIPSRIMPKITFPSAGTSFDVPAGTSLLDFCQSNDTPVDFGCTTGACGTCTSVIIGEAGSVPEADEDEVEMLELTTDKPNARLVCLCSVNGDITVEPI